MLPEETLEYNTIQDALKDLGTRCRIRAVTMGSVIEGTDRRRVAVHLPERHDITDCYVPVDHEFSMQSAFNHFEAIKKGWVK